MPLTAWLVLFSGAASAYETDNLTDRDRPLPDITELVDAFVNDIVLQAIDETNVRVGCGADAERTHRMLAKEIHLRLSEDELVTEREGLRQLGFDHMSAWIEKGGAPGKSFIPRDDIFVAVYAAEAPLLTRAGVCSTVRVNGHRIGTDKLDHFFEEGYNAWRAGDYGSDLDAAIDWTTRTELGRYGLKSSETFSFGDLKADYDGMMFFDSLFDEGGVARLDAEGCVEAAEPFSFRDYVSWEYDEVMNPSVHTPETQEGVTRHLVDHRDAYCRSYARWGGPEYEDHVARVLVSTVPYASPDAPPRTDPYQLGALCRGEGPVLALSDRPTRRTRVERKADAEMAAEAEAEE